MTDTIRIPLFQTEDGTTAAVDALEYVRKSIGTEGGVIRVPVLPINQGPLILVGVQPAPVAAGFLFTPNELDVDFTNTSTGDIASYLWDFGDGNTSAAYAPSHTYAADGTYTVSLTVTGTHGPVDSVSKSVTVEAAITETWQEITSDVYWTPDGPWPWAWGGSYCSGGNAWCCYVFSDGDTAKLTPVGAWPAGWRPSKIVLHSCDGIDHFWLRDTAGNVIASGNMGGAGHAITFQGHDIERLEWLDSSDGDSIYGCITGIHFYGPPLA